MSRTQALTALYAVYFASQPMPPLAPMVIRPWAACTELPKLALAHDGTRPTYRQHHKPAKRRALKKIKKASQKRNRK